jgi:uncharacterized protein (DUF433 family)
MAKYSIQVEHFLKEFDQRQMPRYTFGEAARYLGLPESTIRSWFEGMVSGTQPNIKFFKPILSPAAPNLLSFFDISSAHVLMALHKKTISTTKIREIVRELEKESPNDRYPLLGKRFLLIGKQVIINKAGKTLNLSRHRQLELRQIIETFLSRLELDKSKMPVRFSPIRAWGGRGTKKFIVIDPTLSAGRPVIKGTGIAAEVISKRKASGESVARLAKDYRLSRRAIEEAIKYFPSQKKAA